MSLASLSKGGATVEVVSASATPHPERMQVVNDGKVNVVTDTKRVEGTTLRLIGLQNADHANLCDFSATIKVTKDQADADLSKLRVGFVQNIVRGRRYATYDQNKFFSQQPSAQQVEDDTIFVDCANYDRFPWYRLEHENGAEPSKDDPPTTLDRLPAGAAFTISTGDNPNFSPPMEVGGVKLRKVEFKDAWKMYIALCENYDDEALERFYPLAVWSWAVDVEFSFKEAAWPKDTKKGDRLNDAYGVIAGGKVTVAAVQPSVGAGDFSTFTTDGETLHDIRVRDNF